MLLSHGVKVRRARGERSVRRLHAPLPVVRASTQQPACRGRHHHHGQIQLLLRVSLSVIVHLVVPGGDCNEADPLNTPSSSVASTRRSTGLCWNVTTSPRLVTTAIPVYVVPPQQKR